MFTYKLKIAIGEKKCADNGYSYDEVMRSVADLCEQQAHLEKLNDNEYGTDSFEKGMSVVPALGNQDWFIDCVESFLWYNGEAYATSGKYAVDNVLTIFQNRRERSE